MSDKIALITGGNKGIGFETARQLAKTGVHVIIGSRERSKGVEAALKLQAEGLGVEASARRRVKWRKSTAASTS